jgi:DNA-binding MarR family transcriptional regulator
MDNNRDLLKAIFHLLGRKTFTEEELKNIVSPRSTKNNNQIKAYNFCDGKLNQSEIADKAGIDRGNFSRVVTRWVDSGILVRMDEDSTDVKLLHLYPISED